MAFKQAQHFEVEILQRPVGVHLGEGAAHALGQREQALYVQMELYFSCLLRFKLRFSDTPPQEVPVEITDKLYVSFRPVMTASCGRDYEGDEPPLTDFPIHKPAAFVPKSVYIDFRHGRWSGNFEYQ